MFNDLDSNRAGLKLHVMGQMYRAGHAKAQPIGDKMINAVRDAIWEAWEMGHDNGSASIYPTIPLLDCLTQEPPEPDL